ncbi:SDR family NAD(P)-dependent oxidoreductase [Deinococcus aquiradiocola]|uniref:Ketoacyl reductase n=1 Tax=Deinococcus aquiradiocola TaxID=393059 RepID=A0A917P8L7_9DEIO|nr:SDR family NAD(P)-dependent oxidoreductase [Deinococcus aquiradiocola]GGJ66544.1 ketoacyl reductase [Deinococcus aquiradiocola]
MRPTRLILPAALLALALRRHFLPRYTLTGRRVLVTGGSRGLGLALARELGARGARLVLLARDREELDTAVRDLRGRGVQAEALMADVTSEDFEAVLQQAAEVYGGVDVLVNVAGVIQAGPLPNLTIQDYHEAMDTNFYGPLRAMQAMRPHLQRSGGRVLNVASVGGRVGVPHLAGYSASKFALVGLGQAWRAELAREGVTLTTVLPGLMQTGSARNAAIKGKHAAEYLLFATLDNLPGLSLRADQAARRIVDALERGDAEAVIGGPARLMISAQAVAPQLWADLMGLGARLLPSAGPDDSRRAGREVESSLTRANPVKRRAEAEFNELQT